MDNPDSFYFKTKEDFVFLLKDVYDFLFTNSEKNSERRNRYKTLELRMRRLIDVLTPNDYYYPKTIVNIRSRMSILLTHFEKIKEKIATSEIQIQNYDFERFCYEFFKIYDAWTLENKDIISPFNTDDFYSKKINDLSEKEKELRDEISKLNTGDPEYQDKKDELNNIQLEIRKTEEEQAQSKSKKDKSENIGKDIESAFNVLREGVKPLNNERRRLNWLFGVFAALSIIVLVILICFEIYYLSKWEGADKWIDYIPFYLPVPIVGGLLWAFIYQMNRAQRLLLQIANVLYHIDYCEGLLKAINNLSLDTNAALAQINDVLCKMTDNYMTLPNNLSEQNLDAQISKDSINLNSFINLAKEVKDIFK